jgi:hypothetical protein
MQESALRIAQFNIVQTCLVIKRAFYPPDFKGNTGLCCAAGQLLNKPALPTARIKPEQGCKKGYQNTNDARCYPGSGEALLKGSNKG